MFVNYDCLSVILNHLCYVDQLSLKLTCHNRILLNFKNIFIKRLDKIVPKELTNTFCDELYRTGSYVAGSFILDCLYDTNNHNDIDIYDQTSLQVFDKKPISFGEDCFKGYKKNNLQSSDEKPISFVEDCFGFKGYKKDNLQFTQSLYKMGFFAKHNACGPDPLIRNYIHSNYKYNIDDKNKIQIIPIGLTPKNEKSFITRFINASFDLEICQSIFDGQKLYMKNVNKIIQKYDYIKPNTRFMLTVYPYQIKDIKDVTNKRMKKYQKKGFNIQKHPKFDEINQHIKDIIESKRYGVNNYEYMINYIDDGSIDLSKY